MLRPATLIAAALLLLGAAGAAGAAQPTYLTSPSGYFASWSLTPSPPNGRPAHPLELQAVRATLDVETAPPGERPDVTRTYDLQFGGVHQNSRWFPHCSPRTILRAGREALAHVDTPRNVLWPAQHRKLHPRQQEALGFCEFQLGTVRDYMEPPGSPELEEAYKRYVTEPDVSR